MGKGELSGVGKTRGRSDFMCMGQQEVPPDLTTKQW